MPRITPTRTAWQPLSVNNMKNINDDIDILYWEWSDRLRLHKIPSDPAYRVRIWEGSYIVWWSKWIYWGGQIDVAPEVTSYVMIDSGWDIVVEWWRNADHARLWIVVSDDTDIVSIQLRRPDAIGWELWWGGWFEQITSTTYQGWYLTEVEIPWKTYELSYNEYWAISSLTDWVTTWDVWYNSMWQIQTITKS